VFKLEQAFADEPEDIERKRMQEVLDGVVREYGGDPTDSRQRLDNLLSGKRYW